MRTILKLTRDSVSETTYINKDKPRDSVGRHG